MKEKGDHWEKVIIPFFYFFISIWRRGDHSSARFVEAAFDCTFMRYTQFYLSSCSLSFSSPKA